MNVPKWFTNAVNGAINGSPDQSLGLERVHKCLAQLGWSVDNRIGETGLGLSFNSAAGPRQVLIASESAAPTAVVSVFSAYKATAQNFNPAVTAYLLGQKIHFGAWRLYNGDAGVSFLTTYTALTAALEPHILKVICEELVNAVADFDNKMRREGLL